MDKDQTIIDLTKEVEKLKSRLRSCRSDLESLALMEIRSNTAANEYVWGFPQKFREIIKTMIDKLRDVADVGN